MPKQKTKASVKKRLKTTKTGKLKRSHAKTSHLFANKSTKTKRKLRKQTTVSKADSKRYEGVL